MSGKFESIWLTVSEYQVYQVYHTSLSRSGSLFQVYQVYQVYQASLSRGDSLFQEFQVLHVLQMEPVCFF